MTLLSPFLCPPLQEALGWKEDILAYAARNKEHVTGYPADDIQVFELYSSKAQRQAQTHANTRRTHEFLLATLSHASDPASEVSLRSPIVYGDRLRVRQPGDQVRRPLFLPRARSDAAAGRPALTLRACARVPLQSFKLGPHIDGGSLERWEDPGQWLRAPALPVCAPSLTAWFPFPHCQAFEPASPLCSTASRTG